MSGWRSHLPPEVLADRWDNRIRSRVFAAAEPTSSPTLISLGGVPGAGKTQAGVRLAKREQGQVTRIVGDEFRAFHPDHSALLKRDPLAMPDVTAQAAGEWTRMSVEHAIDQRYPVLVEGTWRNPEVALGTAERAHEAGFTVHAVALVVNPVVSRLATLERYYGAVESGHEARWTPPAAHDETAEKFAGSAARIGASPWVDRVSVIDRSETVLFTASDGDRPERGARVRAEVERALSRPLDAKHADMWLQQFEELHAAHLRFTIDNSSACATWSRLLTVDRPLVEGYVAQAASNVSFGAAAQAPDRGATSTARQWRPSLGNLGRGNGDQSFTR